MLHCAPFAAFLVGLALPANSERPVIGTRMPGNSRPAAAPETPSTMDAPPPPPLGIFSGIQVPLRGAMVHDAATRSAPPLATAVGHSEGGWTDYSAIDLGDLNSTLTQLAAAVNPPVELYGAALSACAQAAEWQGAVQLLQSMHDTYLDVDGVHYTQAIRACSRAGEWARAESLLQRARQSGLQLNHFAFSHVIDACERANESDAAMRVYGFGLNDGTISHWLEDEPFALDLHGFSEHTAACAVRYALRFELGNYIGQDLKIVTGRGKHSLAEPVLLTRIERLLTHELVPPLPYAMERRLECTSRDCWLNINAGCIVIAMQDLFQWLLETRSFESYVVKIPPPVSEVYGFE